MTRIRTTCPSCGEVELPASEVALHVRRDADGRVDDGSWYGFVCPACAGAVRKPADGQIAQLLVGGGVDVAEDAGDDVASPHPENPPEGHPFTADDLIDLHMALQRDDWFERLLQSVR